jgi:hypothetical protein
MEWADTKAVKLPVTWTMTSLQKHIDGHSHIDWNDNVAVRAALLSIIDAVNADVVALTETPNTKAHALSRVRP